MRGVIQRTWKVLGQSTKRDAETWLARQLEGLGDGEAG
jgi:hypothetical protein